MKTIFIPTLAFLVLASGLATAKEPVCYDSKGNVAHCNTTVKGSKSNSSERVQKPTPKPAPVGEAIPWGTETYPSLPKPSKRVEQPAPTPGAQKPTPTPAPVEKPPKTVNNSKSNHFRVQKPAPTPTPKPNATASRVGLDTTQDPPLGAQKPAPVVEKPPVKPTPPPKGGETGSTSSYRGEKPTTPLAPGTAESTTGNEAQKPAPTPSPAPVGATTINGSKSNNYREEKPTTPPASVIAPTPTPASVIAPTPTPAPTTPVKPVKKKPHHGLLKVW